MKQTGEQLEEMAEFHSPLQVENEEEYEDQMVNVRGQQTTKDEHQLSRSLGNQQLAIVSVKTDQQSGTCYNGNQPRSNKQNKAKLP